MKNFPNVHNITLDSLEAVSDNIIKCFKGTLTLPTSFIVDKTFIDKVSEQEITIMANEINDNYNFADGVFYVGEVGNHDVLAFFLLDSFSDCFE